jgi:hypothetical protein
MKWGMRVIMAEEMQSRQDVCKTIHYKWYYVMKAQRGDEE